MSGVGMITSSECSNGQFTPRIQKPRSTNSRSACLTSAPQYPTYRGSRSISFAPLEAEWTAPTRLPSPHPSPPGHALPHFAVSEDSKVQRRLFLRRVLSEPRAADVWPSKEPMDPRKQGGTTRRWRGRGRARGGRRPSAKVARGGTTCSLTC